MSLSRPELRLLDSDEALALAWPVVQQLRPQLEREDYLALRQQQQAEGVKAVGLFLDEICIGYAGYRVQHMLAHGRVLYVDDLVVDNGRRGEGAGGLLMEWLVEAARSEGCASLQLDSGTQRQGAHAFYFGRGMRINAFHFRLVLDA